MPLVRIALREGHPPEYRHQIGDLVHQAMVDHIHCPADDRFQLISEHSLDNMPITPEYLGISYTADIVIIQITLNEGRTVDMKRALYRAIADGLENIGLRREDVFINLTEVKKENWSFGNGDAQYAS